MLGFLSTGLKNVKGFSLVGLNLQGFSPCSVVSRRIAFLTLDSMLQCVKCFF